MAKKGAKKKRVTKKTIIEEVEEEPEKKKPAKKRKKRKTTKRKSPKKTTRKTTSSKSSNIDRMMTENLIALQKVLTNLSIKLDNLADQTSRLLNLFEISAKALAEKDYDAEKTKKDTKAVLEKMDNLFEQNKVLARGITLLHEPGTPAETQTTPAPQAPAPGVPTIEPKPTISGQGFQAQSEMTQEQSPNIAGYQKSISSRAGKSRTPTPTG